MSAAIVTAARARLAAWNGWTDVTGQAFDIPAHRLPAFSVSFEAQTAEPFAMGDKRQMVTGELIVSLWADADDWDNYDPETAMHTLGRSAARDILADPPELGDLAWYLVATERDVDHDKSGQPASRVDQRFSVMVLDDPTA